MRVLLVEDSERLRELLSEALEIAGYMVDGVATVGELFSSVAAVNYDLLIVDLGLPDDEGLDAIRTLRSSGVSKPIIIITARGNIDDRVRGLDGGADDYLIKPFNHAELLARVRALLRRPYDFQGTVLRRGNTELDLATLEVRSSGRPVELPLGQRRLLATLMRGRGGLVRKSAIEEALSEFDHELSANAVEALVSRLRKALSETDSDLVIETVRGVGYRLIEEGDK
jgi:DNA-binding response OmpR family regulator